MEVKMMLRFLFLLWEHHHTLSGRDGGIKIRRNSNYKIDYIVDTQLTIESKIASKFTLNFLFENTDINNTMAMATDIVRSS